MKKRGQITIILIIIVSILIITIIYFMTQTTVSEISLKKNAEKILNKNLDESQIQAFGNKCIESIIIFNINNYYTNPIYIENSIEQLFYNNLTTDLTNKLGTCLDFTSFELQGYSFVVNQYTFDLNINPTDIYTTVNTKMEISLKDTRAEISEFSSKIISPLGLFIEASELILLDFTPWEQINFSVHSVCNIYPLNTSIEAHGEGSIFILSDGQTNITFNLLNGNFTGSCP